MFCLKGKCVCVCVCVCVCACVCVCLHHPGATVGLFPPDFLRQRKVGLHLSPMCVESNLRPSSFHHTISFLMCFSLVKGTLLFLSLIISSFFFLSDSFRFADFNPTSPFFFLLLLSICLLFDHSGFLVLSDSCLTSVETKRGTIESSLLWNSLNEFILAVWYVCVCVSECVLDTVTAGRAAVAGLLPCRAGPCVGGNWTDQLKWDKGGTGLLFNRQPHFSSL